MRITAIIVLSLLAIVAVLPANDNSTIQNGSQEKLIANVIVPFISIYRERRPESEIIVQAKQGDKFVVAQVGQYWARVFVPPNNEMGWIELGVNSQKVEILEANDKSPLIRTFIFPVILMAIIAALLVGLKAYQNSRNKRALENAGPEQLRL